MRTAFVVVLLVGTLLSASVRAQDAAEWERPFTGVLPLPDESLSVNPPERGVKLPRRRAALLLDAKTMAPVPGAVLWCTPESDDEHKIEYGARFATAQADADGLAVLDAGAGDEGFHWIAEAPGYAPTHVSPTYRPEPVMLLRRGTKAGVRVLDGLGRPVADAHVDLYPGCLHGPSVVSGRTRADGRFGFGAFVPKKRWFDVRTPTGARDQAGSLETLGLRPWDIVLEPRWDVRGRIVDSDGKPVAGAAVRSVAWSRAPRALTDADGRFRLGGCSPDWPLVVTPAGSAEPIGSVRMFANARITVRLAPGGTAIAEPEADAQVTIHAVPGESIRLTHESGWSTVVSAADEDEEVPGAVETEVLAGSYVVELATRFAAAAFPIQRFRVTRDEPAVWNVAGSRPQPSLTIRGVVPEHSTVVLAVEGEEFAKPDDLSAGEWRPYLPADAPAALRVRPAWHWNVWFFFPVGPMKDGERRVDVAVPRPHRFRVAGGGRGDLFCDGVEVVTDEEGDFTTTYARGPMRLVVCRQEHVHGGEDEDAPAYEFSFELGDEPAKEPLVLDPKDAKLVTAERVRVRVALPKGVEGSAVDYVADSDRWAEYGSSPDDGIESIAPCRIVVSLAGHQPFDRTFVAAADIEHRWGTATLEVLVRDGDGAPAPAIVGVDGVRHWTSGGDLELAGLTAGPHDIVVSPTADTLGGRALHLVLAEGETRQRTVVVPPRK